MSTLDNLKEAFAGESQANRKYLAFGERAENDGFPGIAKLFRAVAAAETIHAHAHLRAMGGIKDTVENLKAAMAGEKEEFTDMYPPMVAQAQAEGHKAKRMFEYAVAAEAVHAKLYQIALDAVKQGKDLDAEFYLCPICGYIEMGKPKAPCPVCSTKPEKFVVAA